MNLEEIDRRKDKDRLKKDQIIPRKKNRGKRMKRAKKETYGGKKKLCAFFWISFNSIKFIRTNRYPIFNVFYCRLYFYLY